MRLSSNHGQKRVSGNRKHFVFACLLVLVEQFCESVIISPVCLFDDSAVFSWVFIIYLF